MLTTAVIGAKGLVGGVFCKHLTQLGFSVLEVDRGTELTIAEAAAKADMVFIFTLPIAEVTSLIEETASVMRKGTLIVHGTSIENPCTGPIDPKAVTDLGITLAHLHFHFRPEAPLSTTLYGQSVTLSHSGGDQGKEWEDWLLKNLIAPFRPFPYPYVLEPGLHDHVTETSQLTHITEAYLAAALWILVPPTTLQLGLQIAGPPGQLLKRSVLRTAQGGNVAAQLAVSHPHMLGFLDRMSWALEQLRSAVKENRPDDIVATFKAARALFDPEELASLDTEISYLARVLADFREPYYTFKFPPEHNQIGQLVRVLTEFDKRVIDKTTCLAVTLPDRSCLFLIGVEEFTDESAAAAETVCSWLPA